MIFWNNSSIPKESVEEFLRKTMKAFLGKFTWEISEIPTRGKSFQKDSVESIFDEIPGGFSKKKSMRGFVKKFWK